MASNLTAEQRSLRARIAAQTRWSRATSDDRRRQGETAQAGLLEKFARDIDPDGELDPVDRYKRAKNALAAHMTRLAFERSKRASKAAPDAA